MNKTTHNLWPVLLFSCLLITLAGSLHAAPSEQQWQALNKSLVSQHIMPRYQALAESSHQLAEASLQLCLEPKPAALEQAQNAFHNTMDAWQSVQHIQFGPIETLMRNYSMQFWPDKKNLIGKQLNSLLKEQNPDTLDIEYLYRASIGVKGLPALERLLFNQKLTAFAENSYHCQLTSTIASYVAENANSTLTEWNTGYAESVLVVGTDESYYESHQEAAVEMMKSLVEPIEVIRDLKILRPLGDEGKLRPKRTESWRSERSLRNIQLNIASLQHIWSGTGQNLRQLLTEQQATDLVRQIDQSFNTINTQQQLPAPLVKTLYQPETAQQFQLLSDSLKNLHIQLLEAMQLLDIQLGFNSRDGD